MSREPSIDEIELHAYVDGQLDAAGEARVEERLRVEPDAAERISAYRRQNELLRALYDPALSESGSATWPPARRRALRHGAVAAGLLLAAGLGWYARGMLAPPDISPSLAIRAAAAHATYTPEVLHPVEVDARQEAHLVAWLSKRLGLPVRAPDLVAAGFRLVGGRLLPGANRPAAQFMYEDQAGRRLTLYVAADRSGARQTAFRYSQHEGVSVFYWVDGPLAYALSGELPREPLLKVAEAVYRDMNR